MRRVNKQHERTHTNAHTKKNVWPLTVITDCRSPSQQQQHRLVSFAATKLKPETHTTVGVPFHNRPPNKISRRPHPKRCRRRSSSPFYYGPYRVPPLSRSLATAASFPTAAAFLHRRRTLRELFATGLLSHPGPSQDFFPEES